MIQQVVTFASKISVLPRTPTLQGGRGAPAGSVWNFYTWSCLPSGSRHYGWETQHFRGFCWVYWSVEVVADL